ncbi:MAG: secondary thiamine-phosphate synthase enzyme YjbQ [Christensenellaceae bacterium]
MIDFDLETYKKNAFINITRSVREAVQKSGVVNGSVLVYCPHTTAGITITESADPDVCADMIEALDSIVPAIKFKHGEGNSPAHLKGILVGNSVTIPIKENDICMGIWQGIYFCEFDGPRTRKYSVIISASRIMR